MVNDKTRSYNDETRKELIKTIEIRWWIGKKSRRKNILVVNDKTRSCTGCISSSSGVAIPHLAPVYTAQTLTCASSTLQTFQEAYCMEAMNSLFSSTNRATFDTVQGVFIILAAQHHSA